MSSDVTTGLMTPPRRRREDDLSEASRRLVEQTCNEGNLEVTDQVVASDRGQPLPRYPGSDEGPPRTRGAQAPGEHVRRDLGCIRFRPGPA